MKPNKRAPDLATGQGAQESNFAGQQIGAFAFDSKPKRHHWTRGWRVETLYRKKREEYIMSATNGTITFAVFGKVAQANQFYAQIEAEFRGAIDALGWIKHEAKKTPCEIRFSTASFAVFMGESPCPTLLKLLLDKVRRAYITSADAITIDRKRQALVSKEERLAA